VAERLYTVREVAEYLRVSERLVRYWIERGELVAFIAGKRGYRIRQSALDDYVRSKEQSSKQTDTND
jgi:excisionase family DNA binding protein